MKPDKNVTVTGTAAISVTDDGKMAIEPRDGLIFVTVMDATGLVLYFWHPLSGWYIEADGRKEDGE